MNTLLRIIKPRAGTMRSTPFLSFAQRSEKMALREPCWRGSRIFEKPRRNPGGMASTNLLQNEGAVMKKWQTLIALTVLCTASTVIAESIWVKSDNVEIRSGKGAVYPVVASAPKGTELTVISHDGNWVQVQTAGGQG